MREKVFRIGAPTSLNGVLTLPDESYSEVCVLIFNSGLMHHVGTSRISVTLARQLAAKGVLSFRFDFSGLGDSLPRRTKTSSSKNVRIETAEVMDELQATYKVKKFILYGLCSGADASFAVAQEDDRILGIAQIDPYLYRNFGWFIRYYAPRIFNLRTYFRSLRRLTKKKGDDEKVPEYLVEQIEGNGREIPPKEDVERGYQAIISKNCKVLVIVTGGSSYTFNHEKQFQNVFSKVPWQENLEYYYLPEMEHVIPEPEYQKKVVNTIDSWVANIT